ncbi:MULTISPECIES: DLW-39 family protein [unclassified Actinobaculum]|jgi:hypothetical protein|nr:MULTISPECIES: DLW-39 family protein [unclassified Actinobaculum]
MKKFLLATVALAAGYAIWIQVSKSQQDQAVWTEVTDSIE